MQVKINVSPLPSIVNDKLQCVFGTIGNNAEMNDGQVICSLPNPEQIPPTPEGQGEAKAPRPLSISSSSEPIQGSLMSEWILSVAPEY